MSAIHSTARILVVDDVKVNVKLLLAILQHHGYTNTLGITDPREVEAAIEAQMPDLLLLDINMPYLDGHAVQALLRERWGEQAPAVIVLTAQTDKETRQKALGLGARDFLTKPFDQLEVVQRIHNALDVQHLLKERQERAYLLENLVSERTAEIRRLSFQDPVTRLPNRRALLQQLEQTPRSAGETGILFVAFDGLEEIARIHGHAVQEELRRALGKRLQGLLPAGSLLSVWNSTEWIILCQPYERSQACELALRLIDAAGQPIEIAPMQLHVSTRIGISHDSLPHADWEQLIRLAAQALPEQKNSWQFYEAALGEQLARQLCYRQALRSALEQQQMFVVYQPKIDLHSGRVIGAEVLLRWVHPELGFISPADFIPLAETGGEILRIGDWVMNRAIHDLEAWMDEQRLPADFSIAVNVATPQLMQPDFAIRLLERLDNSRLPRGAIEIEVTESGLMQDVERARQQLQLLSRQGVRIAIDDFGTGYSSLSYLKSLPVSILKIDRAFVSEIDSNLQDLRLAETVVQMAHNFGFSTVAEGIERAEHARLLREIGCTTGQGYLYSPPLKPDAFIAFCQAQAPETRLPSHAS